APEVRPLLGAVAGDVRIDDRRGAGAGRVPGQREGVDVEDTRPAIDGRAAVAGVDADDDTVREPITHLTQERGLERGAGPDDGPASPRLQHRLHVRDLAEPATHLDGDRERQDDLADDG